jgi:serine protease AprX
VAPKARLIALKVLNQNGAGNTSDVISAIEFATTNRVRLGVDIINLSLGHPIYEPAATDPLVLAVEAAVRTGIVVVIAAGNNVISPYTGQPAYAGILSPGNAPSAITVGSVKGFDTNIRSDDRVATYSSRGPTWYDAIAKPDLVASGHGLVAAAAKSSTLYLEHPELRVGDSYLRLSGTSMAAVVDRNCRAIVRRIAPFGSTADAECGGRQLEFTALRTLDDQGAGYDHLTQGAGSVDPAGAIDRPSIDASMSVSSWWLTSGVNPWTTIDGEILSWTQNIIWSDAVSDGPVVYVNEPAWSLNIVWGSDENIVWGSDENIVWGSSIVWASDENIVWGSNIVWGNNLIGISNGSSISWGMAADIPSLTVWGTLDGSVESTGSILTLPN